VSDEPVISVCVPAYERPEMLRQLVTSFLKQDYPRKELVISDDSRSDAVQQMAEDFPQSSIRYARNPQNLGYGANLRVSMERATGECVVLMGDDDMFITRDALRRYADAFRSNPQVCYIASNRVQFSSNLRVEYLYHEWPHTRTFRAGDEALRSVWLSSVFIPGIAMRKDDVLRVYPDEQMLFPQVEAVGRMLLHHDGMGLANFAVAGRAHSGQLGFEAIVGRGIKGTERHGTLELLDIFDRLDDAGRLVELRHTFLEPTLVRQYRTMILKERTIVSRKDVLQTYRSFCASSSVARASRSLRASATAAAVVPPSVLVGMRSLAIATYRRRHLAEISAHETELQSMAGLDA